MKKAKIMLTVVVLFTVIGSALAIKAKRAVDYVYVTDLNGICSVRVLQRTTQPGPIFVSFTSITTLISAPCVIQSVYQGT